jgi:hypothetical protein
MAGILGGVPGRERDGTLFEDLRFALRLRSAALWPCSGLSQVSRQEVYRQAYRNLKQIIDEGG